MSAAQPITAAVLTCSDRCSRGLARDESGPALVDLLRTRLSAEIVAAACVPDEVALISRQLTSWAVDHPRPDLILTTGGTGLAPRDVTPEATAAVLQRRHPGLLELARLRCLAKTPKAYLSRGEAGTLGASLILNFPGSPRGARVFRGASGYFAARGGDAARRRASPGARMTARQKVAMAAFVGLSGCGRGATQTATLNVFAAASLAEPFTELGKQYEAAHPGVSVAFNFAGSNVLRLQIEQHAPADIFASANQREMKTLSDEGLINADSVHVFAGNRLTIIIPSSNPGKLVTFADLARPGLKLVAADKAVPAGAYFEKVLQRAADRAEYGKDFSAAVLANVRSREENVEAVVTKVRLGVADAGIAYQSDLHGSAAALLRGIDIPADINPAAEYPIATTAHGAAASLARDFELFVLSPQGQSILTAHDFLAAPTK